MSITRSMIERVNGTVCWLKRRRVFRPQAADGPLKVNLGCGLAVADDWINIDGSLNAMFASWPRPIHRILYRFTGASQYYTEDEYCSILAEHRFVHHDLTCSIPLPDASADFIYSSHFLEHLSKNGGEHLIKEAYRVLRPGGTIRLCLPDLEYAIGLYAAGRRNEMLDKYFFVDEGGSNMARHKYMYDFTSLVELLGRTGFVNIAREAYGRGRVPDLDLLDNRPDDTLFVEATKRIPD